MKGSTFYGKKISYGSKLPSPAKQVDPTKAGEATGKRGMKRQTKPETWTERFDPWISPDPTTETTKVKGRTAERAAKKGGKDLAKAAKVAAAKKAMKKAMDPTVPRTQPNPPTGKRSNDELYQQAIKGEGGVAAPTKYKKSSPAKVAGSFVDGQRVPYDVAKAAYDKGEGRVEFTNREARRLSEEEGGDSKEWSDKMKRKEQARQRNMSPKQRAAHRKLIADDRARQDEIERGGYVPQDDAEARYAAGAEQNVDTPGVRYGSVGMEGSPTPHIAWSHSGSDHTLGDHAKNFVEDPFGTTKKVAKQTVKKAAKKVKKKAKEVWDDKGKYSKDVLETLMLNPVGKLAKDVITGGSHVARAKKARATAKGAGKAMAAAAKKEMMKKKMMEMMKKRGIRKSQGKLLDTFLPGASEAIKRVKKKAKDTRTYTKARDKASASGQDLNALIRQRNKLEKGSPEYAKVQNKINAAYNVKKRH